MNKFRVLLARLTPGNVWDITCVFFMVAVLQLQLGPLDELDSYWHVRLGGWFLQTGNLSGDPGWTWGPHLDGWVSTQPVSEIVMYLVWQASGWPGIVALRIVGSAALLIIMYVVARKVLPAADRDSAAAARSRALLMLLGVLCARIALQERPQIATFLILPFVGLWLVTLLKTGRWPRWWAWLLLVWTWSLFHGGALMAVGAMGLAALARVLTAADRRSEFLLQLRTGTLPVLSAVLVPMLSPAGLNYYPRFLAISQAGSKFISEWQPTIALEQPAIPLWLLIGAFGLSWWRLMPPAGSPARRLLAAEVLTVFGLILVGFSVVRNVVPAALILTPLLALTLFRAWEKSQFRKWELTGTMKWFEQAVVLAAVVGVTVAVIPAAAGAKPLNTAKYPQSFYAALADSSGDRYVLNDYNLGGQLEMLTRDGVVPALDGRADRYGSEIITNLDYVTWTVPGWEKKLEAWTGATDFIVVSKTPIVDRLAASGSWYVNCVDGRYTWLVRTDLRASTPSCDPKLAAPVPGIKPGQELPDGVAVRP